MKESTKKTLGIISWIPLVAFTIWSIYVIVVNKNLVEGKALHMHEKVVEMIYHNYEGVLVGLIIATAIAGAVLLYFIIHLARIRTMNGPTKMGWMVFMVVFGAFAFPYFWYSEIRNEPEDLPMYPSIE